VESFAPQEDITLVGYELAVTPDSAPSANGYALVNARLYYDHFVRGTFVAQITNHQAVGCSITTDRESIMFPPGIGISIREGEDLELWAEAVAHAAENTAHWVTCTLFYVKGVNG